MLFSLHDFHYISTMKQIEFRRWEVRSSASSGALLIGELFFPLNDERNEMESYSNDSYNDSSKREKNNKTIMSSFQGFTNAFLVEKIRQNPQTHLCGVAIENLKLRRPSTILPMRFARNPLTIWYGSWKSAAYILETGAI